MTLLLLIGLFCVVQQIIGCSISCFVRSQGLKALKLLRDLSTGMRQDLNLIADLIYFNSVTLKLQLKIS